MASLMELWEKVGSREAISRPLTGIYLRFLSILLLYGALVHVSNFLGWGNRPWMETPLL